MICIPNLNIGIIDKSTKINYKIYAGYKIILSRFSAVQFFYTYFFLWSYV